MQKIRVIIQKYVSILIALSTWFLVKVYQNTRNTKMVIKRDSKENNSTGDHVGQERQQKPLGMKYEKNMSTNYENQQSSLTFITAYQNTRNTKNDDKTREQRKQFDRRSCRTKETQEI